MVVRSRFIGRFLLTVVSHNKFWECNQPNVAVLLVKLINIMMIQVGGGIWPYASSRTLLLQETSKKIILFADVVYNIH
jgi:hypothetical protein